MNILRPINKEFYGDDARWFFGTVINAQPPAGLEGRVKVRINGVHNPKISEIPEKDLPWAQVMIPSTEGGVSGYGRIPQILAGSFVFGIFLDGKSSQIPLVMGTLPRVEFPTNIQTGKIGNTETSTRLQNSVTEVLLNDLERTTGVQLRRQQSMKFFLDNGYNLIHSAAITGGLQGVSKFATYNATEEETIIGIAGWDRSNTVGSRFNNLLTFSQSFQPIVDWRLYSTQLQYVLYELRNRFSSANRKLKNTEDIAAASSAINEYYLFTTNDTENLAQIAYDEVFV
tara:strand:+ start:11623 stop:12477 length:855 start_codon:yes stop_codon:yes gene_type:complete